MEAVQIIKNLKNFSKEYNENEERELININKFPKENYSYGFVVNMVNNKYEVYMFVTSDIEDVIASNLFYKDFKYLDQAKEYFDSIISKYNELSLEELCNRL